MAVNPSKISVIMVTFNAAKTVQRTLDSIYAQAYPNIEIIVVDGKSTDGTTDILLANKEKIASLTIEKDKGVYDAMNKGLDRITGDRVYFIGADDVMLPAFSDMVHELTDPTAIYYANVFADGAKRSGNIGTRYRMAKFGVYHQAMIYPASVFKKYRYNLKYRISADFALTLVLSGDKNYHFVYKEYTICDFDHTGLSGVTIDKPFQRDKAWLILRNFGPKIWVRYLVYKYKNRDNPRA
ncbi:glycosyltransferase [Mucilaginibacter myungsuensis]|uniref:Glycosyltransferase n=1 Tax=Mucilaginibacter myungsuensis TaxID=649104 RepID=A0A929PXF4_9SPHI|nr:glycosyltransferase [Mucilaginibacter myungsuensis]MBE9662345.1 glycosyltransferase [Mucilaginibacter myungsuensis]MDN3599218.1 glycosyltransferase [Mucilaginibacter myungsuensis]